MPTFPDTQTATESPAPVETRSERLPKVEQANPPAAGLPMDIETAAILAVGLAFALGVLFEQNPLNGFVQLTGWEWPWRSDLPFLHVAVFLLPPLALVLFALRRIERQDARESGVRAAFALGILTAANFGLQVLAMLVEPRGLEQLLRIVLSPWATSYYTDAVDIHGLGAWLRHFDRAMLGFHSSTHPPGPILFYYAFLKMFGTHAGALAGGCAVGFAASLGVPVMYFFAGLWTRDRRTRVIAASLYTLIPTLTVFFPEMDQIYPILSMLLILFWCRSLASEKKFPRDAIFLGGILWLATFFAYNLLTVGVFLAYYAVYRLWRRHWAPAAFLQLLRTSAVACGVAAAAYAALWGATGYDPVGSFWNALSFQAVHATLVNRSYWTSVVFDPYDFLLGAGILVLPLVGFYMNRAAKDFDLNRDELALTLLALGTIATIDLSGVLRGEASRVWLFLQPLLVVPAAIELSRQRGRWLAAILSMQWLILVCLKAKMTFIRP